MKVFSFIPALALALVIPSVATAANNGPGSGTGIWAGQIVDNPDPVGIGNERYRMHGPGNGSTDDRDPSTGGRRLGKSVLVDPVELIVDNPDPIG